MLALLGWLFIMVYTSAFFLMGEEYKTLNLVGAVTGSIILFGAI